MNIKNIVQAYYDLMSIIKSNNDNKQCKFTINKDKIKINFHENEDLVVFINCDKVGNEVYNLKSITYLKLYDDILVLVVRNQAAYIYTNIVENEDLNKFLIFFNL